MDASEARATAARHTALVHSRAQLGIDAPPVAIESHLGPGLPGFSVVGLPETAVREARERVKSAIQTSGFRFPSSSRITVNLAPADLPKEGGRFDLGIALAIMVASGLLPQAALARVEVIGELGLFGEVRAVRGALSAAIAAHGAGRRLLLPRHNGAEAALLRDAALHPVGELREACRLLRERRPPERIAPAERPSEPTPAASLEAIRGQPLAKRALTIAAAGAHNVLMTGPPGAGKTLLARALPALLPPMSEAERLEVMRIHSVAGTGRAHEGRARPFRDPHHSASMAAMIGGGGRRNPAPGEISLAHHGVLFLDEAPEFDARVLEALRQPLESQEIVIARSRLRVRYPARFQLVAAMNPCPAGRDCRQESCVCTPAALRRYHARLSGPLLDRIDLQLRLSAPDGATLLAPPAQATDPAALRERIARARRRQLERAGKANQWLTPEELPRFCRLEESDRALLIRAADHHGLSARSCHRLLRVARSIADLDERAQIATGDLTEALSYRLLAE